MKLKTSGLVIAWLLTRAWVLLSGFQILKYPGGQGLFADVQLYDWWAANMQDGYFPINDPMWQYPPLAAFVFLLGFLIAPNTIGFVFLATAADALIFYYLLEAGNDRRPRTNLPATVWVSTAVFMGPIMLGRFDVFPTFFAVIALIFANRPGVFGTNIAIGSILKIWPALLLIGQSRNQLKKSTTWFISVFTGMGIALTLWWPNSFSFITGQRSRGLQIESVAALPYMAWHAGTAQLPIEFRYGAVEVVAKGIGFVSFIITVIGAFLIGQILYWRIKGRLPNTSIAEIGLYLVTISIITSRVFSPQYMIWIFGILSVCALNPAKNFIKIFALISISALLGQLIFPMLYEDFMMGGILPLLVQVGRITALLIATRLMWKNLKSQTNELVQDRDLAHPESV